MIEIRPAEISDAIPLAELGRRTFLETFSKDNRAEDMDLYLSRTFGTDKQLEEVQDPNRRIAIAWTGTTAVGFYHLFLGPPDPAVKGTKPIELLRLYVDSRWHGKGVGAALMEKSLEAGRREGFATMWLGVWERNFRAQAFYRKYSFAVVGAHVFTLGTDKHGTIIASRDSMRRTRGKPMVAPLEPYFTRRRTRRSIPPVTKAWARSASAGRRRPSPTRCSTPPGGASACCLSHPANCSEHDIR